MADSIKERVTEDLQSAKAAGQLRAERIREIVKAAVSQVGYEVKSGSSEIRLVVRDAIAAVIAGVRDSGVEAKDDIQASIDGAISGVGQSLRQSISQAQAEVKQLQARLDADEDALEEQVEASIVGIEEAGQEAPPDLKAYIESAIGQLKDSEETMLLKKRYAQLQAQVALLRAKLAARYDDRYPEIQGYLEDAKTWLTKTETKAKAEAIVGQVSEKHSQLDQRLADAGTAVARQERKIRSILSDLLHTAAEALQEKRPEEKAPPSTEVKSLPQNDLSDL